MTDVAASPTGGLRINGRVGLGFPPRRNTYTSVAYSNAQPDTETATWLVVRPDSTVTAYAGKVEYGQSIRTGFAMEVADELRLPLDAVEVVLGDTDLTPWDNGTFGSQSTAHTGLQLRKAAATAREALVELATSKLDLPASELVARDGRVSSRRDASRGVSYGDLVGGELSDREIDDEVVLTAPEDFTVMGRPAQRLDAIARVTGAAVYSQDVIVPGMLHAKIRRSPAYGGKVGSVDVTAVDQLPGVVRVVVDEETVAILAESDEEAEVAGRSLRPRWQETEDQASHDDMPRLLKETAHDPAVTQESGSLAEGFALAERTLEATYYVPYVSTVPMEPKAAVARWEDDGRLTLWAGGQRPFGLRAEMAQAFAIDESRVRVIATEVGGGFGTKSYYPVALEAAKLAKEAGRPVRVAYTRADEMTWGNFRPAALIEIKSGFMSDGRIVAWEFNAYHAGPSANIGRRGSDGPYDVPHVRVSVASSDSPLRSGSYRSLGAAVNHFARESHMDEIAARLGIDPVDFRLRNLSHPRFRRVLESAAERFGWRSAAAPSRRGVGVAIGLDVGSYVGMCVQLHLQGSEVVVDRVAAALDCGLTVNPDGAINQVEGSVIMGMGGALYEAIEFQGGRLLNASFTRYRVPRITNTPEIDVALVGDPETPSTGAGEPAIVTVAPAIAGAVHDLTGERIRELPIQRHLR